MDRNTGNGNTGNRNTGNRNTGNGNTGNGNAGDWNVGDCNTGNRNAGSWNVGSCNAGSWNVGDWNTGDCNTGSCNTGNRNTGSCNAGSWNTGNGNAGDWNTGDRNAGYCNTITPEEIFVFNKLAKRSDWDSADIPQWMHADLTKWISEREMTDKEKEAYPSYITTGGYLKYYSDLKHAYIESWEKTSKEDREKTYKLPNFDPLIFKEIFGFNPCECVEEKREHIPINMDIIEINGIKYKRIKE